MAETEKQTAKKPPKGGRKGGTLFPKINLKQSLEYAKKLVSKTHTGAQPEKTILPGVFGNAGPGGKVRASALKQYGLLEGAVDAYKATKLSKDIDAAPDEDRPPLLQRALLNSKLFSQIFETFHGDTVSKSKIEQRAKGLNVHPESAAECAQIFVDSAVTASLGTLSGDSIALVKAGSASPAAGPIDADDVQDEIQEEKNKGPEDEHVGETGSGGKNVNETGSQKLVKQGAKPGVTLTLTVDPSSDPDKLEKQLKLLRHYGMI
jgi:hypothetical protein